MIVNDLKPVSFKLCEFPLDVFSTELRFFVFVDRRSGERVFVQRETLSEVARTFQHAPRALRVQVDCCVSGRAVSLHLAKLLDFWRSLDTL